MLKDDKFYSGKGSGGSLRDYESRGKLTIKSLCLSVIDPPLVEIGFFPRIKQLLRGTS
jgi:hypothetical protein